jgi:hypothetical protein
LIGDVERELYRRTLELKERAYAPYSNFHVGAVLRARDGTLFEGVNVENAAYPLGVCGEERLRGRRHGGYKPGDFFDLWGQCLRRLPSWHVEFEVDRVIYARGDGELVEHRRTLLPDTFVL